MNRRSGTGVRPTSHTHGTVPRAHYCHACVRATITTPLRREGDRCRLEESDERPRLSHTRGADVGRGARAGLMTRLTLGRRGATRKQRIRRALAVERSDSAERGEGHLALLLAQE